jgi:hypothetical protein
MQFFKDLAAHVTGIEVEGSYKAKVEDSGRNHPGETEWVEKVDRNWWGGVKQQGCGD